MRDVLFTTTALLLLAGLSVPAARAEDKAEAKPSLQTAPKAADKPADKPVEKDDEAAYYRIDEVAVPKEAYLEVGGLQFAPDGTLYVCTRRGEIWSKRGADWKLFASGLHEPLGLLPLGNGDLAVAQRPELSRVRDTDGDGRADKVETLTQAFGLSGNYHEYHFGPVRDAKGNFYGTLNLAWEGRMSAPAAYRGWAYKLTPKGEFVPLAVGFRSPAGVGFSPKGELFVTDNQGDWVATSTVFHVEPGKFYGHPGGLRWEKGYKGPPDSLDLPVDGLAKRRTLPAVWLVYGPLGNSPGQPVWDTTAGKFGPFKDQMFIGDQTKSLISRVWLEKVGGAYQGVAFPFKHKFGSGIVRMAFDKDGALWVGGTDRGWGATGGRVFALQTLTYTGKLPFEIETMSLRKDGFELTFTKPVDKMKAADPSHYGFKHWGYKYWKTYGSPQVDVTPVVPTSARVSEDGRKVTLVLPTLVKERVYELEVSDLPAADGTPLLHESAYYTLNRLQTR